MPSGPADDVDFAKLLTQTQRTRSMDSVVAQLRGLLLSGQVAVGAKLPSERALTSMLSVSRTTVREALRILEGQGFVDIRLGGTGGAFFKGPDPATVGDALATLLLFESATEHDLYEYRFDFERENAAIAAQRATAEERALLSELFATAQSFDEHTPWEEIRRLDLEVHELLPRMTHNSVRQAIARGIHGALSRAFDRVEPLGDWSHLLRHEVLEVIDPIIGGRPDEAASAMGAHLERWSTTLEIRRLT